MYRLAFRRPRFSARRAGAALAVAAALTLSFATLQEQPPEPAAPAPADSIPPELADLVGTWRGEWNLFGLDERGRVVPRASWTDRLIAQDPAVAAGRASVRTLDELTFAGLGGKRQVQGTEGFLLDGKGRPGAPFFTTGERETKPVQLADDVSTWCDPIDSAELQSLGLPAEATGTHVTVKVATRENGHVVHRLTRVTTVRWKDAELNDHVVQFTSLQGYHRRD
jgi:hypothetical protein